VCPAISPLFDFTPCVTSSSRQSPRAIEKHEVVNWVDISPLYNLGTVHELKVVNWLDTPLYNFVNTNWLLLWLGLQGSRDRILEFEGDVRD
jgi:hypothetical protein